MITVLSILSSIAVIVYSIITYWQYQLSKKQHRDALAVSQLNKLKDDVISWTYDYLHMSQILMRVSIQLQMDRLEEKYFSAREEEARFVTENNRRMVRINENTLAKDRYRADLDYQMTLLHLIIDDRKPYFKNTQELIQDNYQTVKSKLDEFSESIHRQFDQRMREVDSFEEYRAIMEEARLLARKIRQEIEASNSFTGSQGREDLHALDDEIESFFKK